MRDGEIDEILRKAAVRVPDVEAALLKRVADSIQPSMRQVRPLPRTWVLAGVLMLICAGVGLAGAARAGFYGFEKMSLLERALIFSTLAVLSCVAGTEFVNEMIPGSRRRISAGGLLGLASVVLVLVFAVLFHDYHTERFVSLGFVCLITGVLHAIPAGLLSWLVLRRGFAVNSVSAGVVAGTLAGLAGVGVLELHCQNFQAMHILVWHTAVLVVTAALGALVGKTMRSRA
ncbi:MAG: NrsF family protein [Candidatus Acidiferrum sp.]